jgi:hypothetical protein
MGAEPFFHIFGERGSRMWITFLPFYEIPIPSIIEVLILFTGPNQTENGGNLYILSSQKWATDEINMPTGSNN